MIYYLLYTHETYETACYKLREAGISPSPTPNREFYVEGELSDNQLSILQPYFSIKQFDSEKVKEKEQKRLLESEYHKFRNTEECQEMFSEFIERYNRDKTKVREAMREYFKNSGYAHLIDFIP